MTKKQKTEEVEETYFEETEMVVEQPRVETIIVDKPKRIEKKNLTLEDGWDKG
jgi:hypothetical protein